MGSPLFVEGVVDVDGVVLGVVQTPMHQPSGNDSENQLEIDSSLCGYVLAKELAPFVDSLLKDDDDDDDDDDDCDSVVDVCCICNRWGRCGLCCALSTEEDFVDMYDVGCIGE